MEQLRWVDTPLGAVRCTVTRKRVKNLNLRLLGDGTVALSVPQSCPDGRWEEMVRAKAPWIFRHLACMTAPAPQLGPPVEREEGARLLMAAVERTYPLVAPLGVALPAVKVRQMRTQWGNCHYRQGYITLNTALCRCPEGLRDYVALHELVHFLHPDHGRGFYGTMDRLMPDWRQRRRELKRYQLTVLVE